MSKIWRYTRTHNVSGGTDKRDAVKRTNCPYCMTSCRMLHLRTHLFLNLHWLTWIHCRLTHIQYLNCVPFCWHIVFVCVCVCVHTYAQELVGNSPDKKNWKGIGVALLVIAFICSLIIIAIVFTTPSKWATLNFGQIQVQFRSLFVNAAMTLVFVFGCLFGFVFSQT